MRVKDLMQRDLITISPEATVADLVHRLEESGVTGLPVVADGGQLVGVVSSRDVLKLARELLDVPEAQRWGMGVAESSGRSPFLEATNEGEFFAYFVTSDGKFVDVRDQIREGPEDALVGYTVADIMSPVPITISPDASLPELARLLRDRNIHRVLVVEAERLIGIVTTMDILGELARE